MDTILHAVTPVVILWQFVRRIRWWFVAILATLGAMPDFLGFAEKVIRWDFGVWNWYLWAHEPGWWTYVLFPWALHIWMDVPLHGIGHQWWTWPWLLIDLGLWILIMILAYRAWSLDKQQEAANDLGEIFQTPPEGTKGDR